MGREILLAINQGQEVHQQGKWVLAMAGKAGAGERQPQTPCA